jgi:rubrerythrin
MMKNLTLRKAIEMAVVTEELGAKYYRKIAKKFAQESDIARIFDQLAQDEVAHESQFKKLLDEVPAGRHSREDTGLVLRAAAIAQFFDQKELGNDEQIKNPQDALVRALAFERSTLFYYQSLKEVLGDSPQLEKMIEAERSHLVVLMKVIVSDAKFRGLADPW